MKTSVWGPSTWTFLHAVSFSYPQESPSKEHKQAVLNLFASLRYLLPCGECCSHYCSTFSSESLSKALDSRETFSKWVVDFHNSVNLRLQKPVYKYEDAQAKYLGEDATCEVKSTSCADDRVAVKNDTQWYWIILGLIIFVLVILRNAVKKR